MVNDWMDCLHRAESKVTRFMGQLHKTVRSLLRKTRETERQRQSRAGSRGNWKRIFI